jgi:hypothetical protein
VSGDTPRSRTGPGDDVVKDPDCDLCEAARITPWFHKDDVCWIAECELCATPMVVWRSHGTDPPADQLVHMHEQLAKVAASTVGAFYVDDNMRNIPDHYHAHGRPEGGFFGHNIKRARLVEWTAAELGADGE